MRRVLAPIVVLVGLGGSAGALASRPFRTRFRSALGARTPRLFRWPGLWWWRRPPQQIGAATVATAAYISIMIGSFSATGANPSLQHFGVLAVGILYLILERTHMLVAIAVWTVSLLASVGFAGTANLDVSDITICFIPFLSDSACATRAFAPSKSLSNSALRWSAQSSNGSRRLREPSSRKNWRALG